MRQYLTAATLAAALIAGAPMIQDGAQAAPTAPYGGTKVDVSLLGFLFGGRQYCWYDGGWRGPGWYWCGYASRQGLGWGGGDGWNGHRHGGGGSSRGGHAVGNGGGHAGGGYAAAGGSGGGGHAAGGHASHAAGGHAGGGAGHAAGGHAGGGHAAGGQDKKH